MPWIAILAFPILGFHAALTERLSVECAPLVVPLSVLLGYQYARRGLIVVLLGGVFLVPGLQGGVFWGFGSAFDLWVISVVACLVAAPQQRPAPARPGSSMPNLALAAFLLLPITVGLWGIQFEDTSVQLEVRLYYVALVFLFVAGLAGVRVSRVLVLLALVLVISLGLRRLGFPFRANEVLNADRADLPLLGLTDLRSIFIWYGFSTFTELAAGLASFGSGRACRSYIRTSRRPSLRLCAGPVGVLTLLAAGILPLSSATRVMDQTVDRLVAMTAPSAASDPIVEGGEADALETLVVTRSLLRDRTGPLFELFPLLGFVSAVLLGYRGTLAALLALTVWWTLQSVIGGYFPNLLIPVAEVVVMLGFAALGVGMRSKPFTTGERWWSTGWVVYIAVVIAVMAKVGVPLFSIYLPLGLALAIAAGTGTMKLRRRIYGKHASPHAGWVALLSASTLIWLIWQHLGALKEALFQLLAAATFGAMIEDVEESWWLLGLVALLALWLLLSALRVLAARLPACIDDVRQLYRFLEGLIKRQPIPTQAKATTKSEKAVRWRRLLGVLETLRAITFWSTLAIVVAAARPAYAALREYREDRNRAEPAIVSAPEPTNRYLMQATRETLESWGSVRTEQAYRTTVETGWHTEPEQPSVRRRATVSLGASVEDGSVNVVVRSQTKRHGLWLERDADWSSNHETAEHLKGLLLERARELERKANASDGD